MSRRNWIILGCGAAFAFLVFYLLAGTERGVTVNDLRLVRDGGFVHVAGELVNPGSATTKAVRVEIYNYDAAGRSTGTDTLELPDLQPHQERAFAGPEHDSGQVSSFSVSLNRARDPYGN